MLSERPSESEIPLHAADMSPEQWKDLKDGLSEKIGQEEGDTPEERAKSFLRKMNDQEKKVA